MKANDKCSPVPDHNGMKGPGNAMSIPIKHYPSSATDTKGKCPTIDGPNKGIFSKK